MMTSDAVLDRPAFSVLGKADIREFCDGNSICCLESVPRGTLRSLGKCSYTNLVLASSCLASSSPWDKSNTTAVSWYMAIHRA